LSVSVAAIRPPAAIYREEQFFAWWLYALLAAMVALGWLSVVWPHHANPGAAAGPRGALEIPLSLLIGLVLPPALVVGVLRMTTEVSPGQCRVWFGFVPTYRRAIPLDAVKSVEIVTYHAIRDHLFWGVRTTRAGERVMTARGNRAVRLHLRDGTRVLIGTQRPEELAEALEGAMRPVG
jgi:hypothetical protein